MAARPAEAWPCCRRAFRGTFLVREPPYSFDLVKVAAAVVEREGRYLVARRAAAARHGGLWEFPGGKLHPGEPLAEAVARELAEELGVTVQSVGRVQFRARDPGSRYLILFVEVQVEGEPVALEHEAVAWVGPADLRELDLAPSDARFVREALTRESRTDEA